jgi:hypothetical protein
MAIHRQADDPAAEEILHRGQVQPALGGLDLLDVRAPHAVRASRGTAPDNQALSWAFESILPAALSPQVLRTPQDRGNSNRLRALRHRSGHDRKPLRAVPDPSEAVSARPVLAREHDHGPSACRAQHVVASNPVYVGAPQLEPLPGRHSCRLARRLIASQRRGTRVRPEWVCVIGRQHRRVTRSWGQRRPPSLGVHQPFRPRHFPIGAPDCPLFSADVKATRFGDAPAVCARADHPRTLGGAQEATVAVARRLAEAFEAPTYVRAAAGGPRSPFSFR